MNWEPRLNADGYTYRCDGCDTYKCVRYGSFFRDTRLDLTKILPAMNAFIDDAQVSATARSLGVGRTSLTDFFNKLK